MKRVVVRAGWEEGLYISLVLVGDTNSLSHGCDSPAPGIHPVHTLLGVVVTAGMAVYGAHPWGSVWEKLMGGRPSLPSDLQRCEGRAACLRRVTPAI